jgi:carbon storage regulator
MLVLTRKETERILIGGNVWITIIRSGSHDGRVRIGIEAPPEVDVYREEIWLQIEAERAALPKAGEVVHHEDTKGTEVTS